MMTGERKKYEDDDGRVICNMDVEGMRWHDQRVRREERAARAAQREPLSPSEARRYTWSAVLAALVIVAVFAVTWVLFTLFLTQVWFR